MSELYQMCGYPNTLKFNTYFTGGPLAFNYYALTDYLSKSEKQS